MQLLTINSIATSIATANDLTWVWSNIASIGIPIPDEDEIIESPNSSTDNVGISTRPDTPCTHISDDTSSNTSESVPKALTAREAVGCLLFAVCGYFITILDHLYLIKFLKF